jgi:hypothetical protein
MSSTYLLHPRSSRLDHLDSSKRDPRLLPSAIKKSEAIETLDRHETSAGRRGFHESGGDVIFFQPF